MWTKVPMRFVRLRKACSNLKPTVMAASTSILHFDLVELFDTQWRLTISVSSPQESCVVLSSSCWALGKDAACGEVAQPVTSVAWYSHSILPTENLLFPFRITPQCQRLSYNQTYQIAPQQPAKDLKPQEADLPVTALHTGARYGAVLWHLPIRLPKQDCFAQCLSYRIKETLATSWQ